MQTLLEEFQKKSFQSYKDIVVDQYLYSQDIKFKVLSDVYFYSKTNSLCVDVRAIFKNGFAYKTHLYLSDYNVVNGGYSPLFLFEDEETAAKHDKYNWSIGSFKDDNGKDTVVFYTVEPNEVLDIEFLKENFPTCHTFGQIEGGLF